MSRPTGLSPEFAGLWARHEVAAASARTRRFLHPAAGPLTFTVTDFDVSALPDLRVAIYPPQDQDTRRKLPRTRRPGSQSG
jgi:MmyB-like transcription regulator ligand binding domain